MKNTILFILLSIISTTLFSQSNIESLVQEGIEHHDSGDYDKAIESYKKALKIDAKSPLVNYEIALSYFSKGDYEKTIKHSDVVLKQKGDYMLNAYVTKGSALDVLGKTKESIKLFEKAIKTSEGHYLLFYNLGLNYYKIGNLDGAEKNVMEAINLNPNHTTSHLILASIHNQKENPVQTLLAAHYFLFLEPNTERSVAAFNMLQENFGGNVSKDSEKPNTINIMLSPPDDDNQFSAAELMIGMLEATKYTEENEGKSEDELFVENTESFFKILGELKKKKYKDIWWTFYTPFFYELAKSEHLETYCKYITQKGNEASAKWLSENEGKLDAFDQWLKEN